VNCQPVTNEFAVGFYFGGPTGIKSQEEADSSSDYGSGWVGDLTLLGRGK